jgi:general secretion pathway protein E
VRKLCDACKIGYAPDAGQLRKMNIDPTRVSKLFQARTSPMRDTKGNPVPCTFCQDMAYNGREGAFEVLVVDDEVRQLLISGASLNQLKTTFRKQKGRYIQEKALALVEEGRTSVQEVLRVMKGEASAAPASAEDSSGTRG